MSVLGKTRLQTAKKEKERLWQQIRLWLRETRSVTETAFLLGVPVRKLSRWLQAKSRREWWLAEKKRWAKQRKAARQARWRSRRAQGLCAPTHGW